MLTYVDRVQIAVRDRTAAETTFRNLLGAEKVREDHSALNNADRSVVRAGATEFELLQPAGAGPVQSFLDSWGEGLLTAGFSTPNLSALSQRLSDRGVVWATEGDQVYIEADQTPGLRMVLTQEGDRTQTGNISYLYEITNLIRDHAAAASFYAETFGLDAERFSPIESKQYGYIGQLTLFDPPDRLDRIELSQTNDPEKAMGRYFAKRGESIYMCYAETDNVGNVVEALQRHGARFAGRSDDPNPEGLFIHPSSLHGVLMGVSRTNLAWTWSGRPELAKGRA